MEKTPNYNLNKPGYEDFGDVDALNENFEKIDEALAATDPTKVTTKAAPADGDGVMIADSADGGKAKRLLWSSVKTALNKLFVPLARKINGKALNADVTLSASDIKMPDSDEDVGAAMAKKKMVTSIIESGGHRILFADGAGNVAAWRDGDTTANATLQATIGKVALSLHCVITPNGDYGLALNRTMDGENWSKLADVALREEPEVHVLPLADGWQSYGEGLCWYTRNQFKEVIIGMLVRSTSAVTVDGTQFATLPEGFRPRVTVVAPANATANDYSHSVCHVTINPDGGVCLHFDVSSLSGKTVLQLVCPVFHYPAG